MDAGVNLLILAFAVAALSCTVSKSKMFEGVRHWAKRQNATFGYMVQCPYCMSHWFAFVLVGPWLGVTQLTFVIYAFAVVALSAIIAGVIDRVFFWTETEVEVLREENDSLRREFAEIAEEANDGAAPEEPHSGNR